MKVKGLTPGYVLCPIVIEPGTYFTCDIQINDLYDEVKLELLDEAGAVQKSTAWMKIPGKRLI